MDHLWVEAQHPAPALLLRIDPHTGLADGDFSTIATWLAAVRSRPFGESWADRTG
jgi:hypothetical protein